MPSLPTFKVFISAVSDELGSFRREAGRVLRRKGCVVYDQDYFQQGEATLLEQISSYIQECDAVVFLVGSKRGEFPSDEHVSRLGQVPTFEEYTKKTGQTRASYTQWEFFLSKHFNKKRYLFVSDFKKGFIPDSNSHETENLQKSQQIFREWLEHLGEHYDILINTGRLIEDLLVIPLYLTSSYNINNRRILNEEIKRYRKFVAKRSGYLATEGVDRNKARLIDTFVMLRAIESYKHYKDNDKIVKDKLTVNDGFNFRTNASNFDRNSTESFPISKILNENKHLVILGDPGSGKTTFLKFIDLCFARLRWAKEKLSITENRIPIRISLKDFNDFNNTISFVKHWLLEVAIIRNEIAEKWLDDGNLILLLDGLDEIPEYKRKSIIQAIDTYASTESGRRCRIVITSRIIGYMATTGLGGNFCHYTIDPFSRQDDIETYVVNWLYALRPRSSDNVIVEAKNLLMLIEQSESTKRLVRNPLLLRLAITVYLNDKSKLPTDHIEIYRRYFEDVIWKRIVVKGKPKWNYFQVENALKIVAWHLINGGDNREIPISKELDKIPKICSAGREILMFLCDPLGIITFQGYKKGNIIGFQHLTFHEYFIALCLEEFWETDQKKAWSFLHPRLHHPSWHEPIVLFSCIIKKEDNSAIVDKIFKARSKYEEILCRDIGLASEICYRSNAFPNIYDKIIRKILSIYLMIKFPYRNFLIIVSFGFLVISSLLYLGSWFGIYIFSALYFGFILVLRIFMNTINYFHNYSLDYGLLLYAPKQYHRRKIVYCLKKFPEIYQIQAIKILCRQYERIKKIDGWSISRSEFEWLISELVQGWSIKGLFKAVHDSDLSTSIRENASRTLFGKGGYRLIEHNIRVLRNTLSEAIKWSSICLGDVYDRNTIEFLLRALNDSNNDVRMVAVSVLCERDFPNKLELLIKKISDQEPKVRKIAIEALEKVDDPISIRILQRCIYDENEEVRMAAVKTLVKKDYIFSFEEIKKIFENNNLNSSVILIDTIEENFQCKITNIVSKILEDSDKYVRLTAVYVLEGTHISNRLELLIKALKDECSLIRIAAVFAISKFDDPNTIDILIGILKLGVKSTVDLCHQL